MYTLNNELTSSPNNCHVGFNNSWIGVGNNAGRELYAQASYITNFKDLSVNLNAADVNIGNIHISDSNTGLHADVVNVGINSGALRVITQDLESSEDDVTIGDKIGNFAIVHPTLSALHVFLTNPNITNIPYSYTLCETRTEGDPSFVSKKILIHNKSENNTEVVLTLTSGMSCAIPIGSSSSSNSMITLDLAVSDVNNYNGCIINFFA